MKLSQAPVFLMDAYDAVILFYTKASEMPYPLSPSSVIRETVNGLTQHRKRAPQYLSVQEDDAAARAFVERLLDEPIQLNPPVEGERGVAFNGFLQFVDWIKYASEDYQSN